MNISSTARHSFCALFALVPAAVSHGADALQQPAPAADTWQALFEPTLAEDAARMHRGTGSDIEVDAYNFSLAALRENRPTPFGLGAGFEYQFRANIDDGGRMSALRFHAGASARAPITENLGISLGFRYDLEDFRFSGVTGLAPSPGVEDPWKDIHTLTFTGMLRLTLDEDWSVFGGPVFRIARESGASTSDSFMAGGAIGVNVTLSPELSLGVGIGVVTQIEDDPRPFPIILLHWEVIDNLWLTTRSIAEATGDAGLEVVYVWEGGLETAIGIAYRHRRFRLDEGGGVAPDGVGQHTYIPAWIRVGYRVTPNLTVNAHGGLALAGQLRLEDRNGSRIGRQDYDPAGLLGVNVTFRF